MCEVADTLGWVVKTKSTIQGICTELVYTRYRRKEDMKVSKNKVRIHLRAYDNKILDLAALKIVETVKRLGGKVSGPIPLPTEIEKVTVLRAVHKYKDSREQFESRTHKRLIDILEPSKEVIDALTHLDIPSGVDIDIKL